MNTIVHWLVSALAIGITAFLIPGAEVGVLSALGAAVVIGLLNAFIKPLITLVTLPINVVTLGLFTFVINGLIVWLASAIVPGFKINGLLSAIIFAIVLTVVNILLYLIFE